MDKKRKYLTLKCSICQCEYLQQERLFKKALWKFRCRKHRAKFITPDEKIGKINKCKDCGISVFRGHYRCKKCHGQYRSNNYSYIPKTKKEPKCKYCNKPISVGPAVMCRDCHNKNQNKGLSRERTKFGASRKWGRVRTECFKRDKYQCKICMKIGGHLHSHHIKPYSKHPELRLDINNLLTLCKECHFEYHSAIKQSKKNNLTL